MKEFRIQSQVGNVHVGVVAKDKIASFKRQFTKNKTHLPL